jgi:hypothetical protein
MEVRQSQCAFASRRRAVWFYVRGHFPKAIVYKDRSRDTAWYSIVDDEWPQIRADFEAWLDPGNFDETGRQKGSLSGMKCLRA